jgi:membrane protein YqaA with SNARE-associated domain
VTDELLAVLGIYGGTFVVSAISGVFPLLNSELFLAGLVRFAVDRATQLPGIVIAASTGQMVAKIGLYFAGRRMLEQASGRHQDKIDLVRRKLESWKNKPYVIYGISSVVGLPPFFLTVLAAGAMKIRFRVFLVVGLLGRHLRFAILVAIAWLA